MEDKQALKDAEHLKLLVIFHYVYGGMMVLFGCIPIFHVGLGLLIALNPSMFGPNRGGGPPPQMLGWFFAIFGMAIILLNWSIAAMAAYSGRCLSQRRSHTFCIVTGAILCLFMPMGTALGVCSILVLSRPSVKELFKRGALPEGSSMPLENPTAHAPEPPPPIEPPTLT